MRRLGAVVCLVAAACGPVEQARQPPTQTAIEGFQAEPDIDADNLLSIARGAAVLARSGEMNLTESALHAADGLPSSAWAMPPGGANQVATWALAAPARVESLGISVTDAANMVPDKVRISLSRDGSQWREALVIDPQPRTTPQIVPVPPAEAQFIRVETLDTPDYHSQIRSIHVIGSETGPFRPLSPAGCWIINGLRAWISVDGARVTGSIEGEKPIHLLGGSDGRIVRLLWLQSPVWGHAILTTSPDGETLSALTFFEEPFTGYVAPAWFGTRCDEPPGAPAEPLEPTALLERTGRWSLFGLAFDASDRLVEAPSAPELDRAAAILRGDPGRYRLVAREFRQDTTEANQAKSAARLEALRGALRARGVAVDRMESAALGNAWSREPISVTTQFVLMSRIDVEIRAEKQ